MVMARRPASGPGWVLRMEQSPDGKPRLRRRWRGGGKRGRASTETLDQRDLSLAIKELVLAREVLAAANAMPHGMARRAQREIVLDHIGLAGRLMDNVRRRPPSDER